MSYQPPSEKWHLFKLFDVSRTKSFVCCTLTIRYNIYSMVGRSIASISDLGSIFTLALRALVNMAPQVGYISNGPPYHMIHIYYIMYVCPWNKMIL